MDAVEDVVALIRRGKGVLSEERIAIHPDCGMRLLPRDSAIEKLKVMVAATREAEQD